jgi:hypothetical protein
MPEVRGVTGHEDAVPQLDRGVAGAQADGLEQRIDRHAAPPALPLERRATVPVSRTSFD